MSRILLSGGTLAHAATGAWSLLHTSLDAGLGAWALTGVAAVLPSVLGLVAVVLMTMVNDAPQVLKIDHA